jgi:PIN domain nuclease of toxin-antitoxin system
VIVLDTHAWLWWAAAPRKLSSRARAAVDAADEIGVCAISCWELSMLVRKRRLELDRSTEVWIRQALALPRCVLLPLMPAVAVRAASLPAPLRADAVDALIVATALEERAPLVTKDRTLRGARLVQTIW